MLVFIPILAIFALVGIDQLIKAAVVSHMAEFDSLAAIPGLLDITYVKNFGAAFSLLNQRTGLLIGLVSVIILAGLYLLFTRRIQGAWLLTGATMVLAGGIGNLIDRIRLGYVVDYLDIRPLFSFAIFNFADCCVVLGACVCAVYLLLIEPRHNAALAAAKEQESRDD